MMKFGVRIDLCVAAEGPADHIPASVEMVVEHLIDLEDCNEELLDSSFGLNIATGEVEVEMTVTAESRGEAVDRGITLLRTAIHAAGAATPGWGGEAPHSAVAFSLDDEDGVVVRSVDDLQDA